MTKSKILFSLLLGGTSAVALSAAAYAANVDIPSGNLSSALDDYTTQNGVPLIVSDGLTQGLHTKGAKGDLTAAEALTRILTGTGLASRQTSGAVMIVPVNSLHEMTARREQVMPVRMAAAATAGIESVVVTSSKIKGDIQTVPIAITALSQEELTARQIAGGPDLVKEVPNLTFSKTNFTGYNLEIRGIGTQAISVTTDPAVAVAFNDTPFIRNHFFEQEFFDVSQVEVLRGPQGTLYGRNATAGVVNVVSAKPTDQFEAMLSGDFGNYHNRRYEGMVNIPIVGDKLDLRVAGEWTKRDGYSFNETTGQPIDGRDLWSTRVTLGWKPTSDIEADLIWEHFNENDDRLRSGKQLCKTDFGPGASSLTGTGTFHNADGTSVTIPAAQGSVFGLLEAYFSQGCQPASLYSKDSFQVPNGFSLPFVSGADFVGLINDNIDPYAQITQSTNLRDIQSVIEPKYLANNDTLELNASWNVSPALTIYSDTGYNRDFLWSTEDYNRFDTSPGVFPINSSHATRLSFIPDPATPANSLYPGYPGGAIFCDNQLGCSDRLVVQDLAEEHSWQVSQEFRAESNFEGPLNFSAGGNYLHYETAENYYVFSNTFTMLALDNTGCDQPYVPNVTTDSYCLNNGHQYVYDLSKVVSVATEEPQYVDPNPLTSLNNEGHNYFVSQNPYVLNSYALFGEAYYKLTDDLKLTGGLRWTDDQKHFLVLPSELLVVGYGYQQLPPVDQQWKKYTGRAVLNWTPKLDFTDQTMMYASYAHGYKAGGENPPGAVLISADAVGTSTGASTNISFPVHPATFKPEFIDAFELGTKNTLLDGALTFNADVFYYDYKGYQISQIVDRTSVNLNFDAKVHGAELQATWSPTPGLNLGFAGGYEDTRINNGQYAIDLIDRTAGQPGWVLMKPSVGESSNCVIPEYVAAALFTRFAGYGEGNPAVTTCGLAYTAHVDPVTGLTYKQYPTVTSDGPSFPVPAGYPGFDPLSVDPTAPSNVNNGLGLQPNNGEGFAKPLGGHQLPNAPHFTVSFTGDYTMPVSSNWAATLHSDFYWQSQSWARVFNDVPYDKIRGYSSVNTALILTDASGWQVMGYVKNIFNTTAITGDFLNSDDSGLTTNVFLTDPRLYGIRVTKHFDGGSDDSFDLFGNGGGKPQIWLTLGGDLAQLADGWQKFNPAFASTMPDGLPSPAGAEKAPSASFDWEGNLSYQPTDSDWVLKAGIRYGRSSTQKHLHKSLPAATTDKIIFPSFFAHYLGIPSTISCETFHSIFSSESGSCPWVAANHEFVDSHSSESQKHAILDFTLGKDVGLGSFGKGTIGGGVRIAQFDSRARSDLNADPHYNFPTLHFPLGQGFKYGEIYDGTTNERRSFHGIGPEITWDAHNPVWVNEADGEIDIDWGVNAGLLFGQQRVKIHRTGSHEKCLGGSGFYGQCSYITTTSTDIAPSRRVTVPNLGGYAGLSVNYSNAKVSFGYRADEFFGAMDGGQDTAKRENRGFFGPFLNLSLGFGG
jgi:iron complex outermembrane receptor protein